MDKINGFKESLSKSDNDIVNEKLKVHYYTMYPTLVGVIPVKFEDSPIAQKMGIDKIFIWESGNVTSVEEKIRDQVYPDILIEYESNNVTHTKGWIEKDLWCRLLIYYIRPIDKLYGFYWNDLKAVWKKYGEQWKSKYLTIVAENEGYNSLNIPIPYKVLEEAIFDVNPNAIISSNNNVDLNELVTKYKSND